MDYRSFQLHHECGVLLYGRQPSRICAGTWRVLWPAGAMVDLAAWRKRPWWRKVLEKLLRVFSIWM